MYQVAPETSAATYVMYNFIICRQNYGLRTKQNKPRLLICYTLYSTPDAIGDHRSN